jgi:hypothetical protein
MIHRLASAADGVNLGKAMNGDSKAPAWLFSNHESMDTLKQDLSYACNLI